MSRFEDRQHAGALVPVAQGSRAAGVPEPEALAEANLYAVCGLIAARAARPSTRAQYAGTFRRFCDALRAELGRPPTVADVTIDAIAGYARLLERQGGRAGGPASLATRRVQITMLRALVSRASLAAGGHSVVVAGDVVGGALGVRRGGDDQALVAPKRAEPVGRAGDRRCPAASSWGSVKGNVPCIRTCSCWSGERRARRQNPEAFESLPLCVMDEAHLIGQARSRGVVAEVA